MNFKAVVLILGMLSSGAAFADEGGVSFWIPGQIGSFAATLLDPGWSLPLVYYHTNADANHDQNFKYDNKVTAGLDSRADLLFISPTFAFKDPVVYGQAVASLAVAVGHSSVAGDADVNFAGNDLNSHHYNEAYGFSDVFPTFSLRWNEGIHNFMVYTSFNIPVGVYDSTSMANLGLGHWSWDFGGAYTQFNATDGVEISTTLGFTYNFENPDTNYKNGTDVHFDLAAGQFLTQNFMLGIVAYWYTQISDDSGSGALLSGFRSEIAGAGPQFGWFVDGDKKKWYVNLKGFYEFDANHRPSGWNSWLSVDIPL